METPTSLISGTGGKPLRTERLSAFSSSPRLRAGETGHLFAQEVERAIERSEGQGPQARRLEELAVERRAARREGFGAERASQEHASADEAVPARASVPVAPPSPPAPQSGEAPAFEGSPAAASDTAACPTCRGPGSTSSPSDPEAQPGAAFFAPSTSAAVMVGASTSAVAELDRAGKPPAAPQPLVLPALNRAAAEQAPKARAAAPAPPGSDPVMLERADEILRQIRLHTTRDVRRLTLDLEPVDLGRLSVQLALRSGRITAIVRAESEETLELLESREGQLKQILAQRGVAADSMRFELGFHGAGTPRTSVPRGLTRSPGPAHTQSPSTGSGHEPDPSTAPRCPRIDTLA